VEGILSVISHYNDIKILHCVDSKSLIADEQGKLSSIKRDTVWDQLQAIWYNINAYVLAELALSIGY